MRTTRRQPAKKAPAKKAARKKAATKAVKRAATKKVPAKKAAAVKRARSVTKAKSFPAARGVRVFSAGGGTSTTLHHIEPPSSGQRIAAAVGLKPAARSSLRQFISALTAKGVLKGYVK